MPELPELEVMARVLRGALMGRSVLEGAACHPGILKTVEPVLREAIGARVRGVQRLGQHLVLSFRDDLHVVIHLMVAGRLVLCRSRTALTKATAFRLRLEGDEDLRVIESATSHQASVHVVRDPMDVEGVAQAGIEPLSPAFSVSAVEEQTRGKRRQLKHLLTDQTLIAGIGSIYADEILFRAKLSPIRYASTLTKEETTRLHASVQEVLRDAIRELESASGGATLTAHERPFLRVAHRTGLPCPTCGTKIAEIRYARTQTYYCPPCQSQGPTSGDRRVWLAR